MHPQRLVGLVELLEDLGAHRVEPQLGTPVCAAIADGGKVDAQVRQRRDAVALMHSTASVGGEEAAGSILAHPIQLQVMEDPLAVLFLLLLQDELDAVRERLALARWQVLVQPEEVLQAEGALGDQALEPADGHAVEAALDLPEARS